MKTLTITILLLLFSASLFSQNKSIKEAKGLSVGTKAPLFEAINEEREAIVLENLINQGTVVLFFYRGVWCPYCNRHLNEIQEGLPKLYEKGVKVIAVTPEKPEYISEMAENTKAQFTIVYDKDYKIAKAYDVNFSPKQRQVNYYNKVMNANLKEAHNSEEPTLPIPATYIINNEGTIVWRHFDPNFKKRASVDEILENLPE